MTAPYKPVIAVDFDGVIHLYRNGWTNDTTIDDEIHPEFFPWLKAVAPYYRVVVFSSRSKEVRGVLAMRDWLRKQFEVWTAGYPGLISAETWDAIEFSFCKPPAILSIDDRAVTFQGSFATFTPEFIKAFRPWNKES